MRARDEEISTSGFCCVMINFSVDFVPPLPVSLKELKQRITAAVASLDENMLWSVWTELDYRIDICRVTKGSHIEHL